MLNLIEKFKGSHDSAPEQISPALSCAFPLRNKLLAEDRSLNLRNSCFKPDNYYVKNCFCVYYPLFIALILHQASFIVKTNSFWITLD